MPFKSIRVSANCDMTLISWETEAFIPECRGFAIQRETAGPAGDAKDEFINTYVGFKGGTHTQGESEPSTKWPIQRFSWNDFAVSQGQKVRYRVIPMMGTASNLIQPPETEWSSWSDWIIVGTGQTPGFEAYFNRGIVGAQFLARQAQTQAEFTTMLKADIQNPTSKNRAFLSGPLRVVLLGLLEKARLGGVEIYAALYELNDPEIIEALGTNCNLLLASGAFGKGTDENADVRKQLRDNGKINLFDRLVKGVHFAHNKFIVFCDRNGTPASVWTGSTNTMVTGLCTQVNNGLLITDATIALAYKNRWDALKAAGPSYPASLAIDGSTPATNTIGTSPVTAWNIPCLKFVDLEDASKRIQAAQQGVLFLMFNPGTGGDDRAKSLLQDIQDLGDKGLYIHGVINQEQSTGKAGKDASTTADASESGDGATVEFTDKNKIQPAVSLEAITPHHLTEATMNWFKKAYQFNMVMIHSKVIVIDPFGPNPVVMTGSHNMGPKASQSNDDNLVIIENAPGLAQEYAVNILGVYGHYKWLYNAWAKAKAAAPAPAAGAKPAPVPVSPTFDGNVDSDQWQTWETTGANLAQLQFLLGKPVSTAATSAAPVSTRKT